MNEPRESKPESKWPAILAKIIIFGVVAVVVGTVLLLGTCLLLSR